MTGVQTCALPIFLRPPPPRTEDTFANLFGNYYESSTSNSHVIGSRRQRKCEDAPTTTATYRNSSATEASDAVVSRQLCVAEAQRSAPEITSTSTSTSRDVNDRRDQSSSKIVESETVGDHWNLSVADLRRQQQVADGDGFKTNRSDNVIDRDVPTSTSPSVTSGASGNAERRRIRQNQTSHWSGRLW